MSGQYTEAEAETIRAYVRSTRARRRTELASRLADARRDCGAIIQAIVQDYAPIRIYQWGSLLDDRHFSEMSDIDIAVEGITDPATLSALRGAMEKLTGSRWTSWQSSMSTRRMQTTSGGVGGSSMSRRGLDPELVAEQIDLAFRVLDDMEVFLAERRVPAENAPAPDRADTGEHVHRHRNRTPANLPGFRQESERREMARGSAG